MQRCVLLEMSLHLKAKIPSCHLKCTHYLYVFLLNSVLEQVIEVTKTV